jgi:UDP-N-acetylmuramyl tripeptide synthase
MQVRSGTPVTKPQQQTQPQKIDLKLLLADDISISRNGRDKKDPKRVRADIREKIKDLNDVTKNTPEYKALECILNKKSNDELLDALAKWKRHNY